ncbi:MULTISPECIES: hypothetical protein [Enterococcus]|uniref:hypothetical protein n=1 Tax=Enterococcus TaxID=1350 RepID=UPI001AD64AB7|nr:MULTISPECIES: hypothetical protein [Enterococcus]MBO6324694.1 hypothetical protein [Enterococcus gallinarum]MDK4449778.1 hypothetical protein [Enterococcus casseliflavus]
MKEILRWYIYITTDEIKELKDVKLDGRKINSALKIYLGHSNFNKQITKNLFQEEDRMNQRTAKKLGTELRILYQIKMKSIFQHFCLKLE